MYKGTELLPDTANRNAFINGEPNEKIVKDAFCCHIPNDISIFRGGNKGT